VSDYEDPIKRSPGYIPTAILAKLVRLTLDHQWLEPLSEALGELWNLCENDTEHELIEDLINRYTCLDLSSLDSIGDTTAKQVCVDWGLLPATTLLVATSDNSEADGSQLFLQSIKNKFAGYEDWREANFCNNVKSSIDLLSKVTNVILMDDFIGTGNTIGRRIVWYRKKLKEKGLEKKVRLFVISIAGMEFSKSTLDSYNIDYFCPVWLKKGISDFYTGAELVKYQAAMEAIEARLEPVVKSLHLPEFGYKKSEALFAIAHFNVPNNVFPIFWWPEEIPNKRRNTLFKRLR
jgi:hypothetical protein